MIVMHHIKEYRLGEYTIYELTDANRRNWFKAAPERGGIVISLGLDGEELLYLNGSTFHAKDANVRGGIPILFPVCGQLEGGQYEWGGRTYTMPNHGFARNQAWQVEDVENDEELSLTLSLRSNEETMLSFPFEFELRFRYVLGPGVLTIHQEYTNLSKEPMPLSAGFHPYFRSEGKRLQIESDAAAMLDYNDGLRKDFHGEVDVSGKEAVALLDAKTSRVRFSVPELGRMVTLTYDEAFRYVMLWSEAGRDFICVEPWMAKTGELHRGDELRYVPPGETLRAFLTIASERHDQSLTKT
ncbi:aldose epimerase [Paenibacillus sp. TRM 82003]|nr:aldose epimerase [Paenibacillus sp. TRM 82003]